MTFSSDHLNHLLTHVTSLLQQAGERIIMPAFNSTIESQTKRDGSVVTETDLAAQAWLQQQLHTLDSDIDLLGEEMDEATQLAQLATPGKFWCLDPLDGTTNFAASIPVFGTSLALIEHGIPVLACIHDPVRQETFTAIRGQGAHLNGYALKLDYDLSLKHSVGFIDLKRLRKSHKQALLTPGLYRSQRNIGTCALEWAWLAAGRGHFIIHGGEKIWDYAAGSLLAEEAGYRVSNFNSEGLFEALHIKQPILAAPAHVYAELQELIGHS